jgi:hypothetical protein
MEISMLGKTRNTTNNATTTTTKTKTKNFADEKSKAMINRFTNNTIIQMVPYICIGLFGLRSCSNQRINDVINNGYMKITFG